MHVNNLSNINMIIRHNQYPIAICKPDYLGMVGVFLPDCYLNFPVGTELEIELLESRIDGTQRNRIPMIINNSKAQGTGLILRNFEPEIIDKWQSVLNEIQRKIINGKRSAEVNPSHHCKAIF